MNYGMAHGNKILAPFNQILIRIYVHANVD